MRSSASLVRVLFRKNHVVIIFWYRSNFLDEKMFLSKEAATREVSVVRYGFTRFNDKYYCHRFVFQWNEVLDIILFWI